MPSVRDFPLFEHAPPTKDPSVKFVDLGVVDLSRYEGGVSGLESRRQLAAELEQAVRTQGFFFLTGWGYPVEKIQGLEAVSQAILDLPLDEQLKYLAGGVRSEDDGLEDEKKLGGERGRGFKPRQYWSMQNGVRDAITHFNFRNLTHPDIARSYEYPELVSQHLDEYIDYLQHLHYDVLPKLCDLFDLILEVPSGTIWKLFQVDAGEGGFLRAMLHHGLSKEDELKTSGTWLRGHSDGSALTFLTSQPMASLQFRDYYTGEWKYVAHKPDALVVNIGDLFEFLTGSYFKSTIHRVVGPPADQRNYRRLNLIYFCDFKLSTVIDPETIASPKLARLGFARPAEWERITAHDWDSRKGKAFGKASLQPKSGEEPLPFTVAGRPLERWHQLVK